MINKTVFITLLVLCLVSKGYSQVKFVEKDGIASFFSSAPLEDIEAVNNKVQSVLDLSSNNVVIVIPIRDFKFDKSLMEEHFNENYLESEKYPKATFKGSFSTAQTLDVSEDGTHHVDVDGDLTIHGVTNKLKTKATISILKGSLSATTQFDIRIEDYKVKIPKMVFKNIAEVVEVKADLTYDPIEN